MGEQVARRPAWLWTCATVVAASAIMALGGGCGSGSGSGDRAPSGSTVVARRDPYVYARARFNEMCAGCHTLANAGAHGRRFNLDHDPSLTRALIRSAIRNGEPGMPAWGDVLSRREYEELARYVNAVARRREGETNWRWQLKLRWSGRTAPATIPDRAPTVTDLPGIARQRAIFRASCGGCHTLLDARTEGKNASGEAELEENTPNISTVRNYLLHSYGGMPSFRRRFSRREIEELARYVARVDGCGIQSETSCAPPQTAQRTP